MGRKLFSVIAVIGIIVFLWASVDRTVNAQPPQEVAPYEFAHIPVAFHAVDVKVYKIVHQGCELYVATNGAMGHEAASVAIATGRGCK